MTTNNTNIQEATMATINTRFTYKGETYTIVEVSPLSITARRDGAEYNTVFNGTTIPVDTKVSNTINKTTHPHFFKN